MSLETTLSAYTCTHTHTQTEAPAHTSILTIQSYIYKKYRQLKNRQQTPRRHGMDEDIRMEQKTLPVYNFGKRNVFRLD